MREAIVVATPHHTKSANRRRLVPVERLRGMQCFKIVVLCVSGATRRQSFSTKGTKGDEGDGPRWLLRDRGQGALQSVPFDPF